MNNELDDMKKIWQNAPAQASLGAQQIEALLSKRSKSAMANIRTNILVEFGLGIFITLLLLVAATQVSGESTRMALLQLTFLLSLFFPFYLLALKTLNKDLSLNRPLQQLLEEAIKFWQTALRIYFWGGVLLLPAVFIAVRWLRLQIMGTGNIQFFTGSTGLILLKSALAWLLVSVVFWELVRFSYWRHVERLQKCLDEFKASP